MKVNLTALLSNVLDVNPIMLTPDASAENILEWDSLKALELVTAIEEATGIQIKDEEMILFDSVEKIIAVLRRYGVQLD